MACSLSLKRATSSPLFSNLLRSVTSPIRSVSAAPSVARSFNTNASEVTTFDNGDQSVDVDRLSDRSLYRRGDSIPSFFSDVFDPFAPRSLSQVLNLMDQLMDNPFMGAPRGLGAGTRRGWDVKEDKEALYLRMDMPGLDKENIKITVEQNTLVIRGEGERESEDEEYGRRYSSRIDLPPNVYKIDEIHAEMKHGVLKIRVPKVEEEERKDVYHVQVE
ncbi:hypothetical protein LguiA_015482 [Lonicera macranthoides]